MTNFRTTIPLLAVAAALPGCSEELTPQSLVTSLRILGVRAEPPEPLPGETVTVDALLADPAGGGRAISRLWVACLVGPGGDLDACRDPAGGGIVAMGSGETLSFTAPAAPGEGGATLMVTLAVCAGGEFSFGADGGTGEGMPECVGGDGTVAIKRVLLPAAGAEINSNPAFASVALDDTALDGSSALHLSACEEGSCPRRVLSAAFEDGSAESYTEIVFGVPETRVEEIYTSWFSTSGDFAAIRTGGAEPEVGWTQPPGAGTVQLWVVAHDGRGGQDWMGRTIVLE